VTRRPSQREARARGKTRQRSFRLSDRVLELLDARAARRGTSGNRLAEELLDEALHTHEHPLIYFRMGPDGRKRPALIGTRLYLWQVIDTVRASDNSVQEAAEYLSLQPSQVQACVSYYADFTEEVDAHAEEERELARQEQERWRREKEILA
jgi:uncharacterized protein (DUF433 family)